MSAALNRAVDALRRASDRCVEYYSGHGIEQDDRSGRFRITGQEGEYFTIGVARRHIDESRGSLDRAVDALQDASPETIQRVRNLYERPGTPGEKEAARQALIRLGVDPVESPRYEPPQRREQPKQSSRKYEVTVNYMREASLHFWSTYLVEASDELSAEEIARKKAKAEWQRSKPLGTRAPDFLARAKRKM